MRRLIIAAVLSLFICGAGLCGCTVLKTGPVRTVVCRTYLVTVKLLPGRDLSVIEDSRIAFQAPAFKWQIPERPETLSFTVKVTDEKALREFCSALNVAGITIQEIELLNY